MTDSRAQNRARFPRRLRLPQSIGETEDHRIRYTSRIGPRYDSTLPLAQSFSRMVAEPNRVRRDTLPPLLPGDRWRFELQRSRSSRAGWGGHDATTSKD